MMVIAGENMGRRTSSELTIRGEKLFPIHFFFFFFMYVLYKLITFSFGLCHTRLRKREVQRIHCSANI
jgi:hypothetical protein